MIAKPNVKPSISLLIVEDCKITLTCYRTVLSMACPEVTVYTASNGTKGLEIFKAHLPDIVVTDLNMPEMDGKQMAGNIRAIKPDTKLIVITGDKEMVEQKNLAEKEVTFDHIIEKPIDFQSFFAAIKLCNDDIAQHGS
jgi:CheY-like chemotaxis protein